MEEMFKAVAAVGEALKGLEPEVQRRVLDAVSVALGLSAPAQSKPGLETQSGGGEKGGKKLSLIEFVNAKVPASNPQAIAVFAAYLQEVEGRETFQKADLQPMFAKARMPAPAKYNRDFAGAVEQGWIHDGDDGCYLTRTGEEAVKYRFAGKHRPGAQRTTGVDDANGSDH